MRSNCAWSASLAVLLATMTGPAWCQDAGLPSLLPLPPMPAATSGYPVRPAAASGLNWYQGTDQATIAPLQSPSQGALPAPARTVAPLPQPMPEIAGNPSVLGNDYLGAMKGGYDGSIVSNGSCGTIGGCGGNACCGNHYVYANALLMNRLRPGGFATSTFNATGNQAINFCNQEFGGQWVGGFEVGTGWCFGCNCNSALELVYWGLFPATGTAGATGGVNSLINFSDLNYNGANANVPFTNAQIQQAQSAYNFNSVEANLVGNSLCGGPFGCGMCGLCSGRAGSPWGFGYVAGFRYMNFTDRFLFSSNANSTDLVNDPNALNYLGQFNNNLYGFQLGSGLSYCVTNRLTAYVIGKAGVYDNVVSGLQRVYGTAGNAVINNGPYTGQDFVVRTANRSTFAMSGQIDLGGRWAITNNWSANFGYRVLALAGVATADDNFQQTQFHDVDGVAFLNRSGSFLIHGAYAGATYCF